MLRMSRQSLEKQRLSVKCAAFRGKSWSGQIDSPSPTCQQIVGIDVRSLSQEIKKETEVRLASRDIKLSKLREEKSKLEGLLEMLCKKRRRTDAAMVIQRHFRRYRYRVLHAERNKDAQVSHVQDADNVPLSFTHALLYLPSIPGRLT